MQPDDFPEIDTQTASVARVYDYMLGGTDNYEIDRRSADGMEDMMPGSYALTRNNRRYLERVVHYLASECGIRQFIDHGSGLPTQNNVHQVAQAAAPGSRVVYVEIDPVVLAHGRVKALLAADDSTAFIEADASDTEKILSHPDTRRLINFDEPVAALYISFLHCIPDASDPARRGRSDDEQSRLRQLHRDLPPDLRRPAGAREGDRVHPRGNRRALGSRPIKRRSCGLLRRLGDRPARPGQGRRLAPGR